MASADSGTSKSSCRRVVQDDYRIVGCGRVSISAECGFARATRLELGNVYEFGLISIVHPTDFSDLSVDAFVHALRIAITAKSTLYLLHVGTDHDTKWRSFPHVRHALALWKLMTDDEAEEDPQAAIEAKVGIRVVKVSLDRQDPVRGILGFLDRHPTKLIVLATHGRDGLPRWLHRSVAEAVSRHAAKPTLFIAPGAPGLCRPTERPVEVAPCTRSNRPCTRAFRVAHRIESLTGDELAVHLLHVGTLAPAVQLTSKIIIPRNIEVRQGDVVEMILKTAVEIDADLIAMPTAGHHGILDAMRGSTTERVLRHAPCPVLATPAN
jgi:nucleotide-binding universal stress UspA family protein